MYGIKQLSLVACGLLATHCMAKATTVGLETAERSRAITANLNECAYVDEEKVFNVAITHKCRFFVLPECMGFNILLEPGEHPSEEPVEVGSFVCHP